MERTVNLLQFRQLELINKRRGRIADNEKKIANYRVKIALLRERINREHRPSVRARFITTWHNMRHRLQKQKRVIKKRQVTDIVQRYKFDIRNKKLCIYRLKMHVIWQKTNGVFYNKNKQPTMTIQTEPKWQTLFSHDIIDKDTGEVLEEYAPLYSNNFKTANNKKIKRLDEFADLYQPLFKNKDISLFFFTGSMANDANCSISNIIDNFKYRFEKKLHAKMYGYIWTLEIKPNEKMGGFHVHYHMGIATDRLDFAGGKIPDTLKLNKVWGKRTGIMFVKKNVKYYLAKYFAKNNARAEHWRSTGKSQKFIPVSCSAEYLNYMCAEKSSF
jgi:hypothetical protein